MKSQSSSAARLEFASPEIKVGIDAARGSRKKKEQPMEAPSMPKNKKLIMPGAPEPMSEKRNPNPAKKLSKLPKRRK
jgi:hypothetical protein